MINTSDAEAQKLLAVVDGVGPFKLTATTPHGYTFGIEGANHALSTLQVDLVEPGFDVTRLHSAHYTTSLWAWSPDTSKLDTLARAARAVVDSDGGAMSGSPVIHGFDLRQMVFATVTVLVVAALLGAWRRFRFSFEVRKAHLIQACVHSSCFVYWSLYWPGVRAQVPMIVLMLLMAYGAEAAFAYLKAGEWRVGLSPLPVVFSTNLFVWLDWRGATLATVGAFACKAYIRRGGRHVFNPSVAGLTLSAIATVVAPDFVHFGGLFHTLNVAPDMSEWVFLVSLVPLTMFRLLPVSIGSIVGLLYMTHTPGALRPTLVLMMTLLCTDPATTPRSDFGRFLFGVLVGVSYPVYSHALHHLGQPDDFAKILSVPLANYLVPFFDVAAERARAYAAKLVHGDGAPATAGFLATPVPNVLFVASWIALYAIPLRTEKPQDFEPALHFTWGTPLVVSQADEVARCDDNPIFCKPFSFAREAATWAAR